MPVLYQVADGVDNDGWCERMKTTHAFQWPAGQ
jgi:hypothetical protein